ncbi:monosaccharide-sensing protein 2-like [Neltuma alba]|uniref:monosaccharide-sensing protein 2-like n=1 Tax=Neltuma alba TaxID=207710 RepID=UPI0010A3C91A|nr:monosaccharide-sensing protein 2-like [Prosopis alba]
MREVVIVAISSTLGNMLIGWDSSSLAGGMSYIKKEFTLDPKMEGMIVSMTFLAGTVMTTLAGTASDMFGRRTMLIISSATFILSALVILWAPNVYVILIARLLSGLANALAVTLTPLYISEISPPDIRGLLTTATQFSCSSGMFLAYCLVFSMSLMESPSWRIMLGIIGLPALAYFLVTVFYLPESPRWLVTKGRLGDARTVLQRIRGTQDVSGELALLVEGLSPGGESTSLEEYIVAPASEVTVPMEATRDCIKLYEPNEGALSMVAAPVNAQGSGMVLSRSVSRQASISQSPNIIKDPIVNLFGSMHGDNASETPVQGSGLNLTEPTGTSDYLQLHTPLLLSRQASATDRSQAVVNKNTDIGGGWQLMYKEAGHHQYQRVYLHAEAGGGGGVGISQSQRASFISGSGLDLTMEGEAAAFPASALVSMSALGTSKDVAKAMNDINTVKPNAWTPGVRRALVVGIGLQVLQQAAGINGFLYYGPQVLEKAGIGALLANLGFSATSASLLVNVVITFCMLPCIGISMKLMDIAGRRSIMLYTVPILIVCLVVLVVRDYMHLSSVVNAAITALSVIVYESVFCMGFGVIPNIMCAEIFPTSVRGICISICCVSFWISTLILTSVFPSLLQLVGLSGVFGMFVVGCIVSWLFVYFKVPETKGMPLEVITEFFAIGASPSSDISTFAGTGN